MRLICLFCLTCCLFTTKAQTLAIGDTLPTMEWQTNIGSYKLDSVLPRPLVIVVWASWNPASIEILEAVKQQYAFVNPVKRGVEEKNMDFLDISLDLNADIHNLTIKRENLPWLAHLADYKGWESELVTQLKLVKLPTVLFINQNRTIFIVDPDVKQLRNIFSNIKQNMSLSN